MFKVKAIQNVVFQSFDDDDNDDDDDDDDDDDE